MRRMFLLSIISLMMLALSAGCGSRGGEEKATGESLTPVVVTRPVQRTIERSVSFSGVLSGSKQVMVYPPLPGKFSGYARDDGAYVSKDEVIARIDRDVPGVAYQPVPVKAPISGRFFTEGISPGQAVSPQMPIATVSATGVLKLEFEIPEKYTNSVSEGSYGELRVPTLNYAARARVSSVSSFIDRRSGSARAEATVPNPSDRLAPGMAAQIDLAVARKEAEIAVPTECVLGLDGRFVYLVEEMSQSEEGDQVGKVVKRNVEVGLDDGEFIQILSGLSADDVVLYVGQRVVEEGSKVKITDTYKPGEQSQ